MASFPTAKKTWESVTPLSSYLGPGSVGCTDTYNELGDKNFYYYVGGDNGFILNYYSALEDATYYLGTSQTFTRTTLGDCPGFALAFSSLSQINNSSSVFAVVTSSTRLSLLAAKFSRNIAGAKIRIIGGDNAGYEGTIVSNSIGAKCFVEVTPAIPITNVPCMVEVFAGGIYSLRPNGASSVAHNLSFYDFATDTYGVKSSTNMNSVMTAHTKFTPLPQTNNVIDSGTVATEFTNYAPNGNNLEKWFVATGTTTDQLFYADPSGDYQANRIRWFSGTGRVYYGYLGLKSNTSYTLSFYARLENAGIPTTVRPYIFNGGYQFNGTSSVVNSTAWTRFTYQFTTGDMLSNWHEMNIYHLPVDSVTPCTTYFYGLQIEEGNSASALVNSSFYDRRRIANLISNTNLVAWGALNGASVTGSQTDPTGGTTAILLTDANGSNLGRVYIPVTVNPRGRDFTFSVWAKAGTSSTLGLTFEQGNSPWLGASTSLTIDGTWKRYSFTSSIAATDTSINLIIRADGTYGGANGTGKTIYLAFPQFEYGPIANTYIASTEVARRSYSNNGIGPVSKVTVSGKNWQPGALANFRMRYTVPDSYINLMVYSSNLSDNGAYSVKGTASKTGNTLNMPAADDRMDVTSNFGGLPAGSYTFQIWGTSTETGILYLETYSSVQSRYNVQSFNVSPTMTKIEYHTTTLGDSFVIVVGRRNDGVTNFTMECCQLEYGATAHPYVHTNALVNGYSGGVANATIIDNDTDTLYIQSPFLRQPSVGTTFVIEPNGDDLYLSGNSDRPVYVYDQRRDVWLDKEVFTSTSRGSVPGWEFSADFVNDIPSWGSIPTAVPKRLPSTSYALGDKVYYTSAQERYNTCKATILECTTAGTTSASEIAGWEVMIPIGNTFTDGTAVFTRRFTELNNRYIYSFRGFASQTIHIFDIPTQGWFSIDNSLNFKAGNMGGGTAVFTTGTTYYRYKQYIYISLPTSFSGSKNFRYDIANHKLDPHLSLRFYPANSSASTGQRNFVISDSRGTYLYNGFCSKLELYRLKIE